MKKRPGVQNKIWLTIGLVAFGLILIVAFSLWNIHLQDQIRRDNLVHQAEYISQAIDSGLLQKLSGKPSDQSSLYYQQFKQQLMAARRVYPNVRFMYVLGQKEDGSIFFYIDSESPGSPDESLPGDSFSEITEKSIESIKEGSSFAIGPETDAYGTWITAIAPIHDSNSGEVIAAFGMDVDADDWFIQIVKFTSLPIVLFLILIVLIIGTIHIFQYRPKNPETYRKHFFIRYALVICTGLLGICLTVLLAWYAQFRDNRDREYSFDRLAGFQSEIITTAIDNVDTIGLESIKQFFQGSEFVTQKEFSKFTEHLMKDPFIAAWAWIPQVQKDQLGLINATTQQEISDNGMSSVSDDLAFPIMYISPQDSYESLLGFDLGSIESQLKMLICAME